MKRKLPLLLAVPFLLVGCNNAGPAPFNPDDPIDDKSYAKEAVDFNNQESIDSLFVNIKKAIKNTALKIDNINVEGGLEVPNFYVKDEKKSDSSEYLEENSSTEVTVKDVEAKLNAGIAGLNTAKEFKELSGYVILDSLKGRVKIDTSKGGEKPQTGEIKVLDPIGLSVYLNENNLYLDLSKIAASDVASILAGIPSIDLSTSLTISTIFQTIKDNTDYISAPTDLLALANIDISSFTGANLDETTIDKELEGFKTPTVEEIQDTISHFSALSSLYDLFVGSDTNHGLIFELDVDVAKGKEAAIDAIYEELVKQTEQGQDLPKKEDVAKTFDMFKDLKLSTKVKFDKNFVLTGVELSASIDLATSSTNSHYVDEELTVNMTSTTEVKGSVSLKFGFDFNSNVKEKLPKDLDQYILFSDAMTPKTKE